MNVRGILICFILGLVGTGSAADDLGKNFEASMVVSGTITVNPDGTVRGYTLDQQDKLPPASIKVVEATVPGWRFQPVLEDGKPSAAKTQMSIRIVAHPIDAQHATVRISGAAFGRDSAVAKESAECANGACLTRRTAVPPRYPVDALKNEVSGIVYLVQEIGRDGRVDQQAIRQVNLRDRGFPSEERQWRRSLAEAALKAGRDWTYNVPNSGENAGRDHWIVTIPVNFTLGGIYGYGQWDPYIPGPVQEVSWANHGERRAAGNGAADAIPNNGAPFIEDSRFVLLTPVQGDMARPGQGQG